MKKDQNLPNKNIHSNNNSGKPLPKKSNYSRNQSPYKSSYRGRSPEQRNSRNFSQSRYSQSNSQNNQYRINNSRSNSNRREYSSNTNSYSNFRNGHYLNDRSRKLSYNRKRNYSNKRNQRYQNNRSRNNSYNRSNYHGNNNSYYNRSRYSSQNENPNYNNRKNYSQSPYRNNNRYPDCQHQYKSITPKYQRQINQVQANEETTSDPPGIDNTESTELQLNHINCESTDSGSDTNNTISVNMITVENDYEPIVYEQPFTSHIYENQSELLQDYYTRPISKNVPVEQNLNGINTVVNKEKQRSSTNHIYQNMQKEQPREKI